MAGKTKTDATEALKQVTYLASALKAPRITEAAARLADHARDAGWTHEEYLAAILDREVAARNASGAQAPDPRRQLRRTQDPRRVRLRPPTRCPQPAPRAGIWCVSGRAPQHRAAGPAGHREDPL